MMHASATHSLVLTAFAGLVACTPGGEDGQTSPSENAQLAFPEEMQASPRATAIDAWVNRAFDAELAPGAAVAVVVGDEVVYLGGVGVTDLDTGQPVTPESVFYIASVTKSFVGMLAAVLEDEGAIRLDQSLAELMPALQLSTPLESGSITVEQLLTHTHGIASDGGGIAARLAYTGVWDRPLLVDRLEAAAPAESGTDFAYSNVGYNVFGLALEERLESSWQDLLYWKVLKTLGMNSTTPHVTRVDPSALAHPHRIEPSGPVRVPFGKSDSNMHSAGGLMTTAADLARWMRANVGQGVVDGQAVLPARVVASAHRPRVEGAESSYQGFRREEYGLGVHLGTYDGERFMHHFGGFSGFHAHVSYMPDHGIGVAVLANTAGAGAFLATSVAQGIYSILLERPDLDDRLQDLLENRDRSKERAYASIRADRERRAARSQVLPHPKTAYTGIFENPALGRVRFWLDDGELRAGAGVATSAVEVFNGSENQLRVELAGSGSVATFTFDETGTAVTVRLLGAEFHRVP